MIRVDTACMESQAQRMDRIARELEDIASRVASVNRALRWNTSVEYRIRNSLSSYSNSISSLDNKAGNLARGLSRVASQYEQAENRAKQAANSRSSGKPDITVAWSKIHQAIPLGPGGQAPWYKEGFWDKFFDKFGWDEALAGSNHIKDIYDLVKDFRDGKTWRDFGENAIKTYEFLTGAFGTFKNYKKIGNAVGTKTAMTWWAKHITGLKPLGRASTAKNPITRFANNLTNKTSPFNAQWKNVLNNFTGKNGIGKAAASWAAVALNGVINHSNNRDEQAASGGTMSDGRVWAETIVETAVDTALTYGASIVVGAAVTTVIGTAAAPGVLVVAATGAVIAAVNAGVEHFSGKTVTEWVSDGIINAAEGVGKAVKNAGKAVGKWFTNLSFA